ncbi:hypothetical protein KAR91_57310 [Candidatus Pacearchaeota archaeon]|nr:hypothetical protein [Candidatus Pacearchaeota archaeon]
MDEQIDEISKAIHDINRNLLLMQGRAGLTPNQGIALEDAVTAINEYESGTIHDLRHTMEDF